MSEPERQVRVERHGGAHVARLAGEIDLENARLIEAEILEAFADADAVVIDLGAVSYFDSSGMRMLDGVVGACEAANLPLRVVAPDPGPARMVLRIVAWPEAMLAGSLEEALQALDRR